MPAFTDAERRAIRDALLDEGRRLFTTVGLRKTSLDELTRPAGIHKTSFYAFFPSKEALYLELLAQEGPGVQARTVEHALTATDPAEALRRFLTSITAELTTNPVVRRLVSHPDELRMVARKVGPEQLQSAADALAPMVDFVEREQRAGRIVDRDARVIVGVLRAVTMLTLHRDDIGSDIYDAVLELVIELLADGLTTREGEGS